MLLERTSLLLNLSTLQLQGALTSVDVTDVECQLLCCLLQAQGHRMEGALLLARSGLPAGDAGKNALSVRVARLRKKLVAAGASDPTLKSIRHGGYQLCVPLQLHGPAFGAASVFTSHESQP